MPGRIRWSSRATSPPTWSAADSSELIDSSAANNLGLYNALLAVESLGIFEKFRPYAVQTAATLKRLGGNG